MKKVLLLTENFPPKEGGSGRWFWELYRRLPSERVMIVTNVIEGSKEFDKTHQLNIQRVPLQCSEWGIRSVKALKFYWRTVFAIKKIAKENQIDEIHCGRVIHEGVIAWFLKLVTGIPYLCFVHGEDVETAATSREHAFLVKRVIKHSYTLICNSQNSANLVSDLKFGPINKCKVVHPGVDLEKFKPAKPDNSFREKMGWDNRRVILTVGRLQKRKGQDFTILAMKQLSADFPDLLYVIVGQGECLDYLNGLIAEHNLSESVQIHTHLNDHELIKCYQQCDVFLLPNRTIGSDIEGFGMVLVEAQACGKAVIAGDSGGTKETMLPESTGVIIDASSVDSIALSLTGFLNESKYKVLEKESRKFSEDNFSWEKHLSKFESILTMANK